MKSYEHVLPDIKHRADVNNPLNGESLNCDLTATPKFSPEPFDQVTLKSRVSVVPTVTSPKSMMVPLAGLNDMALAGETVRGSTPPMLRHRAHPAISAVHVTHPSEPDYCILHEQWFTGQCQVRPQMPPGNQGRNSPVGMGPMERGPNH